MKPFVLNYHPWTAWAESRNGMVFVRGCPSSVIRLRHFLLLFYSVSRLSITALGMASCFRGRRVDEFTPHYSRPGTLEGRADNMSTSLGGSQVMLHLPSSRSSENSRSVAGESIPVRGGLLVFRLRGVLGNS